VATSPFRAANNGLEVARELGRRHAVEVDILSSRREALLAYLGNTTLPEVAGRRSLVVDLGGGSAEIAVGEGTRCIHAISLPVGAVRMSQLIARDQPFGHAAANTLSAALNQALQGALERVRGLKPERMVFASGTARAVRALIARGARGAGKDGPLCADDLRRGLAGHLGRTPEQLCALGVDRSRADTVLVAATVMNVLAELSGMRDFYVSDRGLRDGVALEIYRDALRSDPLRPAKARPCAGGVGG
jgi:exopolyphosphatase/guanosine-5'-triphosphate,3'-diphosphate pyrophosphatase